MMDALNDNKEWIELKATLRFVEDNIPNGSFWNNYVFFDEFKILSFTNCFSNLYLIDNLSELLSNVDRNDLPQALLSIEKEAIEHNKTIIIFVSPNESYAKFCADISLTIESKYYD